MEEHRVRQVKIVEALEAEKKKISNELKEMQRRRAVREEQLSQNGEISLFLFSDFAEHIMVTICLQI